MTLGRFNLILAQATPPPAGAATLVLEAAGEGAHGVAGTGAAVLAPEAAGEGSHAIAGTGAAVMSPEAAATAAHGIIGDGAATLSLVAEGSGTSTAPSRQSFGAAYYDVVLPPRSRERKEAPPPPIVGNGAATLAFAASGEGAQGVSGSGAAGLSIVAAGRGVHVTQRFDPVTGRRLTTAELIELCAEVERDHQRRRRRALEILLRAA